MDLIHMLDSLGEHTETLFPMINHGGCAVFASEVATRLKQRFNLSVRIRTSSSWMDEWDVFDVEEARRRIDDPNNATSEDWCDAGIAFGHVIVEFQYNDRWHHYDTSGVCNPKEYTNQFEYTLFPGHLTVDEALSIANKPDGWNPAFDRKHIPTLRNTIDEYFNQLTSVPV